MLQAKKEQPVVNVKARTFKFLLDVRASFLRFLFSGHRSYSHGMPEYLKEVNKKSHIANIAK